MGKIDRAIDEFYAMEKEARGEGRIQALHPLAKLFVTVFYLVILLSFHKYDLAGTLLMAACPIFLFTWGNIPARPMWRRMRIILIPVCLVGIANPFFDHTPVFAACPGITGGMVSLVTLLLKGILAVSAAYLLMVTTTMDDLCRGLRKLHVPSLLVTVILLVHRYLIVFLQEVDRMRTAYQLRAPGQKGIHFRVWGPMAGLLLLRSADRADAVYQGMALRGFNGDFPTGRDRPLSRADILYLILGILIPLTIRFL